MRLFNRLKQFLTVVLRNTSTDQVSFRATSLAYTTLLSLVPLTMVVFSFGGFDEFGGRIIESVNSFLLPEGNDAMVEAFNTFTSNAQRLGTLGSLLFLIAAAMLLNTMEKHLNTVFRAGFRRGTLRRIATYIASLALIAFLFGVGLGPVSGMLETWNETTGPWQQVIGVLLSLVGVVVVIMLLFGLLSSAKIRFRSLLMGSFVGALGFQGAKFGFTLWTTYSARQSVIYGSMVFIPLLLIWLNVAWIIVLIAAEITYAHQIGAGRFQLLETGTPASETKLGWNLYLALVEDFCRGTKPPDLKSLSLRLGSDERRIEALLKRLENGGLVHTVAGRSPGYIPGVAPADLEATKVIAIIAGWDAVSLNQDNGSALENIRQDAIQSLEGRTIRSFLPEETEEKTGNALEEAPPDILS